MKVWLYRFFLLSLSCCSFLFFLPASWIQYVIPKNSPIQLSQASGRWWQGSAYLTLGHYAPASLQQPIQWHLAWDSYPQIRWQHPAFNPTKGTLTWRGTQLILAQQAVHIPASSLRSFHAFLDSLKPQGELSLAWPTMAFSYPLRLSEAITLRWTEAATSLNPVNPLGQYELQITPQSSKHITLNLSSLDGPLHLEGTGNWTSQSGWQFQGEAYSTPAKSTQLHDLLLLLGPIQNGRAQLRFPY